MRRSITWIQVATGAATLLIFLVVCWGCGNGDDHSNGEPPPLLRAYEVTPELAPELTTILNELLWRSEGIPPAGRVRLSPSGQLLVAAPESVHDGIEEIIAKMETAPQDPAPMIAITYWIVAGHPTGETTWSPRLREVEQALETVTSAEGSMTFDLIEKVELHSLSGESGSTESRLYRIDQKATARGDRVFSNLQIKGKYQGGNITSRVNLRPDQFLVLGQSALSESPFDKEPVDSTQYFIIRCSVEGTSSD